MLLWWIGGVLRCNCGRHRYRWSWWQKTEVLLNLIENESLLVLPKLEVVHPLHNSHLSSSQSLERNEQGTILYTRDSNVRL